MSEVTPEHLRTITDDHLAKMIFSVKMINPNAPMMKMLIVEKQRREDDE